MNHAVGRLNLGFGNVAALDNQSVVLYINVQSGASQIRYRTAVRSVCSERVYRCSENMLLENAWQIRAGEQLLCRKTLIS